MGQSFDRDFLSVSDVDHLTDGAVSVHQTNQAFDGVAHVAETARLLAATVDGDGRVFQRGFYEIGENHAVAPGLTRADGVEQTNDDNGKLFFFPIRERQKFVERFRCSITPATFGRGAKYEVSVFVKRNVNILPVDFRGRGGKDELALLASSFQNHLRAIDVGFDSANGTLHDELNADGGGQVNDDVGIVDQLGDQLTVFDAVQVILHERGRFQVTDIF